MVRHVAPEGDVNHHAEDRTGTRGQDEQPPGETEHRVAFQVSADPCRESGRCRAEFPDCGDGHGY